MRQRKEKSEKREKRDRMEKKMNNKEIPKYIFPKKMTEILLKIVQATTKKAGQTIEILTEITTVPTAMEL